MSEVVLTGARLLNGVTAGIYIAFLVAFMSALHGQPDEVYARVMNRLNVVIVNPVFLAFFLGAPLLALVLLGWHRGPLSITAACLAIAAVVITVAANLPLNDALANGGAVSSFERPWLIFHTLRTLAATGAFVLLSLPGVVTRMPG
ncbi:anthrone oxygenase family protein [Nocardioides albus]|uniref:Putative membrane protein n=1 Tax=Nocardioides albus TaxID=1841 RepID=A0A7W5A8J5_9ACTN|nr:anthrone oxygenase family protein [Nocardioides albus]MBB3091470.1 putative membrane protein [Nocardioides albus]